MSTNMFEIATRNKFRFPFKGVISTEDLWDLSVVSLDNVFKTLNSEMKKTKEEQTWKLFILQQIKKKYRNCLKNMR